MHSHTLRPLFSLLLSTLGAIALTGCPKDTPTPPAPIADMAEDMVADADMLDVDLHGSTPSCYALRVIPKTFNRQLNDTPDITWTSRCNVNLTETFDISQATLTRQHNATTNNVTLNSLECFYNPDATWDCDFKLAGLTAPPEPFASGPEALTLTLDELVFKNEIFWHITPKTPSKSIVPLPKHYHDSGLGVRTRVINGKPAAFGAVLDPSSTSQQANATHFLSTIDGITTHATTSLGDINTLKALSHHLITMEKQHVSLLWALNDKTLTVSTQHFERAGTPGTSQTLSQGAYTGPPIDAVLDASFQINPKQPTSGTLHILARDQTNAFTQLIVTLDDNASLNLQPIITQPTIGQLKTIDATPQTAGLYQNVEGKTLTWGATITPTATTLHLETSQGVIDISLTPGFTPDQLNISTINDTQFLILASTPSQESLTLVTRAGDIYDTTDLPHPHTLQLRPTPQGLNTKTTQWSGRRALTPIIDADTFGLQGRWRGNPNLDIPLVAWWSTTTTTLTQVSPLHVDHTITSDVTTHLSQLIDHEQAIALQRIHPSCDHPLDCAVDISHSRQNKRLLMTSGTNTPSYLLCDHCTTDDTLNPLPTNNASIIGPPTLLDSPELAKLGAALVLAPIQHPDAKDATHAIWTIDASGQWSQPHWLTVSINTAEAQHITPTAAAIIPLTTDGASFGILWAIDDHAPGIMPLDVLKTTPSNTAHDITLNTTPQLRPSSPEYLHAISRLPTQHTLLPYTWPLNDVDPQLQEIDLAFSGEGEDATTVKTIAFILMENGLDTAYLSRTGTNCGTLELTLLGTFTTPPSVTPLVSQSPEAIDCADAELILGTGHFVGDRTQQHLTIKNKKRRTRRRKANIKRKLQESWHVNAPILQSIETLEAPFSILDSFDPTRPIQTFTGDYNGDGLTDIGIQRGEYTNTIKTGSTVILFSDGLGGFLPEPWILIGRPETRWTLDGARVVHVVPERRVLVPRGYSSIMHIGGK